MCGLVALLHSVTADGFSKVAVGLAALFALVINPFWQWRIAKRQAADNVSAKRQIWIDELRKEAAEFLTLMARLEDLRRPASNLSLEDQKLVFDEKSDAHKCATELGIRIKLRLNPQEDEHIELVRLLRDLSDACLDPPPNETKAQEKIAIKAFSVARDKVISHLQKILKHEWERVKQGKI